MPGASTASTNEIDAVAGRERDAAVARQEWLGGLAVDRHHGRRVAVDAQRHEPRAGGIDEAQPQPLVRADRDIERRRPLTVKCGCAVRSRAVGRAPVIEDQRDVAVDVDRLRLVDDQQAVEPAIDLRERAAGGTRTCRHRAA